MVRSVAMEQSTLPTEDRSGFIKNASFVYIGMAVVGLVMMHFLHKNLYSSFETHFNGEEYLVLVKCVLIAMGLSFFLNYLFEEWFPGYKDLRKLMVEILGATSVGGAFYLALLSGVGEEIFFRGALQPYLGLWGTSILFGLVHLVPGGKVISWSLAAGLVGVILGFI